MSQKTKYKATPTRFVIHQQGQPMFAEGAITVELEDEGGGAFGVIANVDTPDHKVRIDTEEAAVLAALLKAHCREEQ